MKPEQIRQCADQLVEFHKRLAPVFYEKRQAHWCYKWLHGLLLDGVRKNAAKLARAVPGANVQAMQQFISDSPWDHRKVIAQLQGIVAGRLAEREAVLVVDACGLCQEGPEVRRGQAPVFGHAGEGGQLPGGRLYGLRGPQGQLSGGRGALPAQGMGPRPKAAQGGGRAQRGRFPEQTPTGPSDDKKGGGGTDFGPLGHLRRRLWPERPVSRRPSMRWH